MTEPQRRSRREPEERPDFAAEAAHPSSAQALADPPEAVFSLRDLGVLYSGAQAVEGVTFDLHAREITAFIGPSGCG
ncbi:MAG: hypothetical protein QOC64_1696, partial [Solirubrobacteraceae bacterium]|nr:hypothetical protein [Solirubrobacteraceae bacterium]